MPVVFGDLSPALVNESVEDSAIIANSSDIQAGSDIIDDIVALTPSVLSSDAPVSPNGEFYDSGIAENASSEKDYSSDHAPSTPAPVVSPNPGSPSRGFFGIISKLTRSPTPSPLTPPAETESAVPPVPTVELAVPPVPAIDSVDTMFVSTHSIKPSYPSRLTEVAEQKNLKLCMQILAFWRSGIMKEKLDSANYQLDETSRASMIVLHENEALKSRIAELERAIVLTHDEAGQPHGVSVSVGTEEDGFITPKDERNISEFATPHETPMRNEFRTPNREELPTLANLPTTLFRSPRTPKSTWEDHLRPSAVKENFQKVPSRASSKLLEVSMDLQGGGTSTHPTSANTAMPSRSSSISKEKLREISADLQRLSESLAARQTGSVFSSN